MSDTFKDIIGIAEIDALRERHPDLVLLEIRNSAPGDDAGAAAFRAGHIPGAVHAELARDFADPEARGRGARPLPRLEVLEQKARLWGIGPDTAVIVYDDGAGTPASRAWWTLKWAGLAKVAVLDGGLKVWTADGRALEAGESAPRGGGTVGLAGGGLPELQVEEVLPFAEKGVLIDARPSDVYASAGHIPGAISRPAARNLEGDGRLLEAQALASSFEEQGVDGSRPVAVYCGGGVAATHHVLALRRQGIDAALYVGSWSEWTLDPARPVARD